MRGRNYLGFGELEPRMVFEKAGLPLRFLDKEIADLPFAEDEKRKKWNAPSFKLLEAYRKNIETNLRNGVNLFLVSEDRFLGDGVASVLAKDILMVLKNWNLGHPPIYYLSYYPIQDLFSGSQFDSDAKSKRETIFKSQVLIFSEIDSMLQLRDSNPKILLMLSSILKERNLNLKTSIFVSARSLELLSQDFMDIVSIIRENCTEIGLLPKRVEL